jgi:hypothetical protein
MMVVTDLDGTLLDSGSRLSEANRAALERLGTRGIPRVVATGRSLYSARRVLSADFPIDYLVFSSGAGICEWPPRGLLVAHHMARKDVELAVGCVRQRGLDFMLHDRVPDSHRFFFWESGQGEPNPDFLRRRELYREFADVGPAELPDDFVASQLLAIEPPQRAPQHAQIAAQLRGLSVILTTSPLDHCSRWIEIFPASVSKSRGAAWLCARLGVEAGAVLALGNDFNDLDLLAWSGRPHVVANAPPSLRARYPCVPANDADGFAHAVSPLLA